MFIRKSCLPKFARLCIATHGHASSRPRWPRFLNKKESLIASTCAADYLCRRLFVVASHDFSRNSHLTGNSGIDAFRTGFQARFQTGLDELVQIAVEYLLGVGALDSRAQILDARLVQHIVADL